MGGDDLGEPRGVRDVNGFHPRMIAFEERPVGGQLGADRLIMGVHRDELVSERLVHDYLSSLNACTQSWRRNPGMHQRMQSGSMARAASAFPMSAVSQPN